VERYGCEEAAKCGTDTHAEVYRQPVERKGLAALFWSHDVRDGGETGWPKHLRASGPQYGHGCDRSETLCQWKQQQHESGCDQGHAHDGKSANAITEASTDWTEHNCRRSVDSEHGTGARE